MKNLFSKSGSSILAFLVVLCAVFLFASATTENSSSPPSGIKQNIFTTSADTLTASDTLEAVVKLQENTVQSVSVQLRNDAISGTPNYTATISRSLDGVYYSQAIKSVTINTANDTTLFLDSSQVYGTYLKVRCISQSGTQKSRLYGVVKTW